MWCVVPRPHRDGDLAPHDCTDQYEKAGRTLQRDLDAEWNVPYWLVNPAERTITRYGDSVLSINENAIFQS